MHHPLEISLSDYQFSKTFIGLSQVQIFCIFYVKYGLDKPYFKVLSWWEVASFDSVRFIFEVGGVLECVISAVCILGNPTPTLRVAEEAAGLRPWSHDAASTVGLGVAQELLTPVFPAAAEPGAVPDSRLWHLWESRSPCQGAWCQRRPSPPACLSSCPHYWAQPASEADVTTCSYSCSAVWQLLTLPMISRAACNFQNPAETRAPALYKRESLTCPSSV